jgi:hypothetical protein
MTKIGNKISIIQSKNEQIPRRSRRHTINMIESIAIVIIAIIKNNIII